MLRDGLSPETHAVLGVKGGGCSGLTYTLDFDDRQRKFDIPYTSNGLSILVDKKSHYTSERLRSIGHTILWIVVSNSIITKGSCGCKTSIHDRRYVTEKPSWM